MQAVLFKTPGQEWRWLGGMTLLERNLRLLSSVGVEKALVLHPPGDQMPLFTVPRALTLEVVRSPLEIATADPLTILPALREELDKPFLLFDANLLVDPRVLATMSRQPPPSFMVLGNGAYPPPWRVGVLAPRHLTLGNDIFNKAQRVSLLAVPSYDADLRGEAAPYCEKMASESDLQRGWRLLIDRVSKRPADVVEKYIDPPVENWLVRTLCDTAVTPNQVTLLSIAFALAGASLFYQGWCFLGVLFAWTAIVLDGVDGKLARVKLMTSPIGKLEHVADFFYENAWYLALAARFAHIYGPSAWTIGLSITACDLCDNVLTALFAWRQGKTLDEMSAFDQRFRLIGGRRSIYLLILLAGFLSGAPFLAFQAVLAWATLTVLIHAGRAAYHIVRRKRPPA
ncbi:MAG TPA: CDP-alcohol phosphatidyltransferase family protein [Methylomirabilota bacterium]|jgi:phosphatidylglycerophosphate synthase|nr:CDP-alcohol phosphatidyltransferase family protein [Methylomirabilota bacterium]